MEGPINKTVLKRLPAAIKPLDETCQKVYICLRLRKPDHEIAKQLNLTPDKTQGKINTVSNALSQAGQLDLIKDPYFVSIQTDDPDTPEFQISSNEIDIDKKLVIKQFLECLKERTAELPVHQMNILKLRYKHQMPAKSILGFSKKMGVKLVPDKEIKGLKEQDVFYALNTALKIVFKKIKHKCIQEETFNIDNLKYIFEEIGI